MPDFTLDDMADAVFDAAMLTAWQAEALRARILPPQPDIIELADIEERARRLVAAHEFLRDVAGGK